MKITLVLIAAMITVVAFSQNNQNCSFPTSVIVDAKSAYVMKGDTFFAQVIPVFAGKCKDKITFENKGVPVTGSKWEGGILKLYVKAENEGMHKFSGDLVVRTDKGDTTLSFSSEFIVARPAVSIMTKYLIKDIENPVEISVTGIPPFFKLTAQDTDIKGDFGRYTIIPHKTGILKLNIKSNDGKTDFGEFEFEVFEKK